jgi:polyphosphate kinase
VQEHDMPGPGDAAMGKLGTAIEVGGERPPDLSSPHLYVNRELSLIAFQGRVLEEAEDPSNPLMERVKFLAIVGSNLDEFFMVRVAGLKQQIAAGVVETPPDGMTPSEQLDAVRRECRVLMRRARDCWNRSVRPDLESAGVEVLDYDRLSERERAWAADYFVDWVFPVLTPLAFDPGRPFPHISNLSLNLAVIIEGVDEEDLFARVKVPSTLPRLVPLPTQAPADSRRVQRFVWLEQLIAAQIDRLFPGMTVTATHPFRVTRDADVAIQELEAADLLETIEQSVRLRRFGNIVRITTGREMSAHVLGLLLRELDEDNRSAYHVQAEDVFPLDPPIGLSGLMSLYTGVDRPDLRHPHFVPALPADLRSITGVDGVFDAVRRDDILLHHPYQSFDPVVDFLRQAARDPDVLAIKQTLYRVGRDSPVVRALLEARENGKQVAVLVELKARFDEESNIVWARQLERSGVHVVYGLVGLKTHSKVALVVRREGDTIRRYVHLATGNYNPTTARLYTDLGLFTCDPDIAADASDLFNYLTGYSAKDDYRRLLVAPINLRRRLRALIEREIEHAAAGRDARMVFKVNSLIDQPLIELLYEASRAGVTIDLCVRGMCALRPGLPGVSDRIRVTSIVGRFLEHSRVYYFANGGADDVFLGSADLMPRNLDRRVEVVFPVLNRRIAAHLRDVVLAVTLRDNVNARVMAPDGTYALDAAEAVDRVDGQAVLLQWYRDGGA